MRTFYLVAQFCLLVSGSIGVYGAQADLDDIAKHLDIKVDIVENLDDGSQHLFKVTFENKARTALPSSNWTIYFYSFFVVEPKHLFSEDGLSTRPEGYVLQSANLKFNHKNGNLFSMSPTSGFTEVPPNGKREVSFFASLWAVSKSDVPPRWYIVVPGLTPRVLESTITNFVADFTNKKQWKRTADDTYNPYSTAQRFQRYKTTSNNVQKKIVIPTPKNIRHRNDKNTLEMLGNVIIQANGFTNEATYLSNKTGFTVSSGSSSGDVSVVLTTNSTITSNEGYRFVTDPMAKKVHIQGKTSSGIFYGIQTLLSLLADGESLPELEILDEPRFGFRGMYIDISRNFIPKNVILKLMDAMAMYKLNKLHIHLADDEGWRLEIEGLHELTRVGSKRCHTDTESDCLIPQLGSGPDNSTSGSGFLTKKDYMDILKFATERHIEVIPEVDMPGHARAAIKAMEERYRQNQGIEGDKYRLIDPLDDSRYLSVQYFNDNAINPCINSTYTFIDKIVTEIKNLHSAAKHPLKTFHFGGDEVAKTAWLNSSVCKDLQIEGDMKAYLKKYFAERVSGITSKHGLNLQGWEDGFMEGGGPFPRNTYQNTDVIGNAWDNVWEWGAADRAYNLANAGYKVVLSHATHLYFDHPYEPDPEERGLYWAPRFTDSMKTFGYLPDSLYENIDVNRMGVPLTKAEVCKKNNEKCPSLQKQENIIGMQGHLWSETILSSENVYYMIFPRLLALAERAWHKAAWESDNDESRRDERTKEDWDDFAYTLGRKELKRLDDADIKYRVPPPGAIVRGDVLVTNSAYPDLPVEYSIDGKTWKSRVITNPGDKLYLRARSADGSRYSRVVTYTATTTTTSAALKFASPCITLILALGVFRFIFRSFF